MYTREGVKINSYLVSKTDKMDIFLVVFTSFIAFLVSLLSREWSFNIAIDIFENLSYVDKYCLSFKLIIHMLSNFYKTAIGEILHCSVIILIYAIYYRWEVCKVYIYLWLEKYTKAYTKYIIPFYKYLNSFETDNKYVLKSMPFLMSTVPEFSCVTAITLLNIAMLYVNDQLAFIDHPDNNVSAQQQLELLQRSEEKLDSTMEEVCENANENISHVNVILFRYSCEYHGMYEESSRFYDSPDFHQSKVLSEIVNQKVRALTDRGFGNNESISNAHWKIPEERWRTTISKNVPLHPVENSRPPSIYNTRY